ncbi:leucyl aminopeptidase [Candidatus Babeliales bacterium]|nr:leucyl aminopeptidase [Candidatus Babeliales bacterium]
MKLQTQISTKSPFVTESKAVAILLSEKFNIKDLNLDLPACGIDIEQFLQEAKFTGAAGSIASLTVQIKPKKIIHLFFAGLGSKDSQKKFNLEILRRAVGTIVKLVQAKSYDEVAILLPDAKDYGVEVDYFLQQVTVISYIAFYKYDKFITTIDQKDRDRVIELFFCLDTSDKKLAEAGHEAGVMIGDCVNQAREWVDTPPSKLTPTVLAEYAQAVAKEQGLKCTVFGEKEIIKMGMGGIAGVSAGSNQDAQFVILEYKSKKPKAQTIGFVGKGITFDSGGLSIKPANSMEEMKEDMAGAASVINAMAALSELKPDVNVIGFAAITENLLGCSAQKPGDIITFYNGKTAEVRNTDAEGRLVLADALSYAVKNYKLDAIIDVATLTGACIYAVGPFFSAMLSDNDELAEKVHRAGELAGDRVWRLPFTPDFKEAVKSHIADIQNVGNPAIAAGTITAAWFLRHFTGDVPWVHLDIASSAYNVPNISYFGKGATGSSVRLLIEIAMQWKNK